MHSLLSLFLQKCRSDSIPNKGARGMVLVFLVVMVCALEVLNVSSLLVIFSLVRLYSMHHV